MRVRQKDLTYSKSLMNVSHCTRSSTYIIRFCFYTFVRWVNIHQGSTLEMNGVKADHTPEPRSSSRLLPDSYIFSEEYTYFLSKKFTFFFF